MTTQEAIKMLVRIKDRINFEVTDSQKKMDALNMAIRSLEAWEKVKKDIKQWYWDADKQALRKDPCVVDGMIDLFIFFVHGRKLENTERHQTYSHAQQNKKHTLSPAVKSLATLWSFRMKVIFLLLPCNWV